MLYKLLKHLLFQLPEETAHHLALNGLKYFGKLSKQSFSSPTKVMGLDFDNPIGLAAGLDKNGDYIDALANLGFGFIEIGTVTPKPQPGNPKPRLFRLIKDQAIINRMGFNNKGVDYLVEQVKRSQFKGILGINIGKNAITPLEHATQDYLHCLEKVYLYASYITVNISSPNTPGLRNLQHEESLNALLDAIKQKQHQLQQTHDKHVPIAIKIAPDMSEEQLQSLAHQLNTFAIDGVIATNTTIGRPVLKNAALAKEAGGLSGKPLTDLNTQVVASLRKYLHSDIPIIAAGGIMTGQDAKDKVDAGASLVQCYTGLIYRGASVVKEIIASLR